MAIRQLEGVAKFAEAMELDTQAVVRGLALELFIGFTEKTPVKTGTARRSWQIGVSSPKNSPTDKLTGDQSSSFGEALQPDISDLKKIDGKETVYITSNLDYIGALEEGHSKRAPNGMVELTVIQTQGNIDARVLAELGESLV